MISLGQPPVFAWIISILALITFFYLEERKSLNNLNLFKRVWWLGFGYFLGSLNWIVEPFYINAAENAWMAPLALIGLSGFLAIFWSVGATFLYKVIGSSTGVMIGISLGEISRGFLFTGFPWAELGYIWTDTPISQLASVFGIYGLTFCTLIFVVVIFKIWYFGGFFWGFIFIITSIGTSWYWGESRSSDVNYPKKNVIVRIIQPNVPQEEKWVASFSEKYFSRMLEYTGKSPRPDVIIWPETALPVPFELGNPYLRRIAAKADKIPVVLGALSERSGKYFNSIVYIDEEGESSLIYDKYHLVPFGEYLPFERYLYALPTMLNSDLFATGYQAGKGPEVLNLGPLGKVLPLICYEAIFPQNLSIASNRAQVLLHITNDAWFGNFSGPFQHFAKSRVRSIEQGLPLIRVANTGISALVDPFGYPTQYLEINKQGFLDVKLPSPAKITLYGLVGDWILVFMFLAALVLGILDRRYFSH